MKALVIGYGSIGERHVRVLKKLGMNVAVVSRRANQNMGFYPSIQVALDSNSFDYIVVANETIAHYATLQEISKYHYEGKILVEKPLFSNVKPINFNANQTFVAYNLRFHPLIQKLKSLLKNEQAISVNVYAGQYLPNWRPQEDYTKNYSAFSEQGGGVLRDLSHELDYLTLLFGEWSELVANIGTISQLNIQSEDYVNIVYKTIQQVQIALELNYLDRITQRYMSVQTNTKTIKIDFIANTINCNEELEQFAPVDRDYTYLKQHNAVWNDTEDVCTFNEGFQTIKMIEAIEKSALLKEWVYND
ncbi:Gfo/Idh/MocA family oxidoreductase [Metasolibacillus meyeri]|uniref:Gfo/Idh/MocA family oxidoreductase n=1 Tax=Metasolibacillus meyeri TaxID=1071052 RepID=A0AAW9NT07_9BACL|nr:Gfo/Idh/MocA family oxidoreductase [Metasolibacillus meyeri]MEC1178874.1 Gfo/Idh/MocA family oxidoreductase [Metasolibacillus meyeri]